MIRCQEVINSGTKLSNAEMEEILEQEWVKKSWANVQEGEKMESEEELKEKLSRYFKGQVTPYKERKILEISDKLKEIRNQIWSSY